MNITPIKKEYINPINVRTNASDKMSLVNKNLANVFNCPKTIVKNTPIEFSNSRGCCLAEIDLTDFYVKNAVPAKVSFLADMELSDTYELPDKKVSNISFKGKGAKYLYIAQHSAIDLYRNTKRNFK